MTSHAQRVLRYFNYDHLPEPLRSVSEPFHALAVQVAELEAVDGAEQTTALRKLLESKDCAVRCVLGLNGADGKPAIAPPGQEDS